MAELTTDRRKETQKKFDEDAQMIYQRGFGLVKEGKLGTAGLGPCIAWVAYNKKKYFTYSTYRWHDKDSRINCNNCNLVAICWY